MKKTFLIVLVLFLCIGCFDLLDLAYWKDGDYRVSTDAGDPNCVVLTHDGLILLECVHSIGSNKEYIIATQVDNQKRTWYWLIEKKEDSNEEKPEGPFNLDQFSALKIERRIPDLEFEKSFERK